MFPEPAGHSSLDKRSDNVRALRRSDNLYVVDGNFFCSSGAVNPALTIIANALHVGDRLLNRMNAERSSENVMAAVAQAVDGSLIPAPLLQCRQL